MNEVDMAFHATTDLGDRIHLRHVGFICNKPVGQMHSSWSSNWYSPDQRCENCQAIYVLDDGQADDEPNEALRRAGEAYQAARQRWAR